MKIYWIDDTYDNASRTPTPASRKRFKKELGATLEVKSLASLRDFEELTDTMNRSEVYGVLMDYKLLKVGAGDTTEYGTTWAANMRSSKPFIPIVGLSAENESAIPKFRIENFLAFFKRSELIGANPPLAQLSAIFGGYRVVWDKFVSCTESVGVDLIVELLQPPQTIIELLRASIPSHLRSKWDDESCHSATRWIWHDFQGRTGFLFDELEASTYLGLTKEAFGNLRKNKHFNSARYRGVHACEDRPRWWACMLRNAVENIIGNEIFGPTSHSRDDLLKALRVKTADRKKMLAIPRRRDAKSIPECVAYIDQDSKNEGKLDKRAPAMLRDTVVDDVDANPPIGFQSVRHFKFDAAS